MADKAHIPGGIGTLSKGNTELCTFSVKERSSNTFSSHYPMSKMCFADVSVLLNTASLWF